MPRGPERCLWAVLRRFGVALWVGWMAPAAAQDIAITFDDLPYVMPSRTPPDVGLGQVRAVNRALAEHGIVATGFVFGSQVNRRSRPALEAFVGAGHRAGNHTWTHSDYGTLSARAFRREVRRTDRVLQPYLAQGPKYFRYPYLRRGETEAAKAAGRRVLTELGYRIAPVSIDNDEWQFNAAYLDALEAGDSARAAQIADRYITHMQERSAHYAQRARAELGRDAAHILLLHLNQINADNLHRLLGWYDAEAWRFVTLETALRDPLYAMPDGYTGPRGLSQIERVFGQAR